MSFFGEPARQIQIQYNRDMYFVDQERNYTLAGKTNAVAQVLFITLFVIACVTIGGGLSAAGGGWSALGLGVGALLLKAAGKDWSRRKVDLIASLIFAAAFITMGILGGVGTISSVELGGALIGILGAHFLFYCCILRGKVGVEVRRRAENETHEHN